MNQQQAQGRAAAEEQKINVVLVGMTQSVKSSIGNSLISGIHYFPTRDNTLTCEKRTCLLPNQFELAVIDTPGLFNNRLTPEEMVRQVARCVSFCAPSPHVFLIVIDLSNFRRQEIEMVNIIISMFGEEAGKHMIVLFTNRNINYIAANGIPWDFIEQYDCHIYENNLESLINKITEKFNENRGSRYRNRMLDEAEQAIQGEMQRRHLDRRDEAERDNLFIQTVDAASGRAAAAIAAAAIAAAADAAAAAAAVAGAAAVDAAAGGGDGVRDLLAGAGAALQRGCIMQ